MKEFSLCLRHNNITAKGDIFTFQDRNIFIGEESKCQNCRNKLRSVDQSATKYDRMLSFQHMIMHNAIIRCIYLELCLEY